MALGEETNKKIKFSAIDDVSPFMKKLLGDQKNLYAEFAKSAKDQTNNQKEQLKLIEQSIKALERKSRLEKEIMREQVRSLRENGGEKEQFKADQLESQLRDRRYSDKNTILSLKDRLHDDRDSLPSAKKESVFSGTLMANLLRDVLGSLAKTVSAKTEFDLITPFATTTGTGIGAALGSLTGWLSPGAPSAITQAGKELGAFVGAGQTRHLMAREDYLSADYRVRGLTGGAGRASDLSGFGFDRGAGSQLEESIVRAIAKGTTTQQVKDVAAISKALSLDTNTVNQFLGMGRTGQHIGTGSIMGMQEAIGNNAVLPMALQNAIQLSSVMGQTGFTGWGAIDKIKEGNNMGGPFSAADPRSVGFLSTIQGNLTSPQSAFAQALSYQVLRKQLPQNASIVDILKARQEGGSEYERGILDRIGGMTGDSDLNTLMYSNTFGTGNIAVDQFRLANKNKVAGELLGQQVNMTPEMRDQLYSDASRNTTTLQRSSAEVTNAFIVGFTDGIEKLSTNFTNMMGKAIDEFIKEKFSPMLKILDDEKAKTPNMRGIKK